MIIRFTVNATRDRFMERPLTETHDYYIEANDRETAHDCLFELLRNGGWKVNKVTSEEVFVVKAEHSRRIKEGMNIARANGKHIGRPVVTKDKLPEKFKIMYNEFKRGGTNISEIARICELSRPTVYKYIRIIEG